MRNDFLSAGRLCLAGAIFGGVGLMATAGVALAASPTVASLAGVYDGGQMEIGAQLELKADGTFQYELAYGALDEQATGKWSVSGNQVLLTSAPVTPPRFTVVSQEKGDDGALKITMDFKDPYQQQDFDALIQKSDGKWEQEQLGVEGLSWNFPPATPPTSVRLAIPVYSFAGEAFKLDPKAGNTLKFHFEANDLGKVAFNATPLKIVNGELLVDRFDRTLKFRRAKH